MTIIYFWKYELIQMYNDPYCLYSWLFDVNCLNTKDLYTTSHLKTYDSIVDMLNISSNMSKKIIRLASGNYKARRDEIKRWNEENICPFNQCILKNGITLHLLDNQCNDFEAPNFITYLKSYNLAPYQMQFANRILILKHIIEKLECHNLQF
eukprot:239172_1